MSTYFQLLGIPESFILDGARLDERYRALSQQWHPDKLVGAAPKERIQALERTTLLNDAYKTLRDPAMRAAYLLKLRGIDLDREGPQAHQMAPGFLMEILELREELDAAGTEKNVEKALAMGRQMAEREKATHARIGELFGQHAKDKSLATLNQLADQVAALRYYRRFQDEVAAIEEESLA